MRSRNGPTSLLTATLLTCCLLLAPPAAAQTREDVERRMSEGGWSPTDDSITAMAGDVTALAVNTSIWLSQHLPAMMAQAGTGAGIEIGDDAGGVSLGIIPVRIGLFNQFSQIAKGLEVLDLEGQLPGNVPWPQFGVTAGVGVGFGIEIGADLQFIPEMDLSLDELLNLKVGVISASASVRWRINQASGAVPAFVLGLGGSYYRGIFRLGAQFDRDFSFSTEGPDGDDVAVEGHYAFSGAPRIEWELWQITPEMRLGWDIAGVFRPYIGFGFGVNFGSVTGGAVMEGEASVDSVAGQTVTEEPQFWEKVDDVYTTSPARYTFRPHIGFDIAVAFMALTLQFDWAIMSSEPANANLSDAADDFDATADGGLLYSEASKQSQTSSALIGTLALRFQF